MNSQGGTRMPSEPPTVRCLCSYSETCEAIDELEELAKDRAASMSTLERMRWLESIKPVVGSLAASHDATALRMLAAEWRMDMARAPMPTLPFSDEDEPKTERRPSKWS